MKTSNFPGKKIRRQIRAKERQLGVAHPAMQFPTDIRIRMGAKARNSGTGK